MKEDIIIDAGRLRERLEDECGAAMCSGFPAAAMDLGDIDGMDGYELCQKAEEMGIDLRDFEM